MWGEPTYYNYNSSNVTAGHRGCSTDARKIIFFGPHLTCAKSSRPSTPRDSIGTFKSERLSGALRKQESSGRSLLRSGQPRESSTRRGSSQSLLIIDWHRRARKDTSFSTLLLNIFYRNRLSHDVSTG
jgi:hypothetical protein